MNKKGEGKKDANRLELTHPVEQLNQQSSLVFFRHPKLDNPKKAKTYYRVEHTPAGVRIWTIN